MSLFDGRAADILFATVLESKYIRRRLKLNASVADVFDGVSGGGRSASRGSWWQFIGEGGS